MFKTFVSLISGHASCVYVYIYIYNGLKHNRVSMGTAIHSRE